MHFFFDHNDVSTVDDRVAAIFARDASMAAIAKREMLNHDNVGAIISHGDEMLNACYSFTEEWLPFENIEVLFDITFFHLGTMDLITLKHGGFVRISQNTITVHLITEEGEMTSELNGNWDLLHSNVIRIQRIPEEMCIQIGVNVMRIAIEENCRKGLEVVGLFGEVSNMGFEVRSISVDTLIG